jgi:hypothetical protein
MRIKEIYGKQKSSKTRKMKLKLIRECKYTLAKMIANWRMTIVDAEDKNFKILKGKIVLERNIENNKYRLFNGVLAKSRFLHEGRVKSILYSAGGDKSGSSKCRR